MSCPKPFLTTVMNKFDSFEELELELKRTRLKRNIAKERLKATKLGVQSDIASINWLQKGLDGIKKYGSILLLRKLFKTIRSQS